MITQSIAPYFRRLQGVSAHLTVVPDDLAPSRMGAFFLGDRQFLCLSRSLAEAIEAGRFPGLGPQGMVDAQAFERALMERVEPAPRDFQLHAAMRYAKDDKVADFLQSAALTAGGTGVLSVAALGPLAANWVDAELLRYAGATIADTVQQGRGGIDPFWQGILESHQAWNPALTTSTGSDLTRVAENLRVMTGLQASGQQSGPLGLYDLFGHVSRFALTEAVAVGLALAGIHRREQAIEHGHEASLMLRGAPNTNVFANAPLLAGVETENLEALNRYLNATNRDHGRWISNLSEGFPQRVAIAERDAASGAVAHR